LSSDDSTPAKLIRGVLLVFVVLLVLALFPYTQEPTTHVKILLYQGTAVLCLGIVLAGTWWRKEPLRPPDAFFVLMTALLALHGAAVFVAVNRGYSLFEFTKWAALYVLFVVAAYAYRTPKQVWTLLLATCWAVAAASVYGFAQFAGWDPIPWAQAGPIARQGPATFGNPNLASHVLVPAVVFAAGLAMCQRRRWALGFLGVFLAHLAITRTRAAFVALAAALVLVVAARAARRIHRPKWAVAAPILVVALVGVAAGASVLGVNYWRTGTPYPFETSLSLRYHSFYGACRMIADKPLLGRGPGGYLIDNSRYWTPDEQARFNTLRKLNAHVHNEPLEIAVDAGIGAGILYLALLVVGLWTALRLAFEACDSERRTLGLTLAAFFVAYGIDGLFGFNVHVPVSAVVLFLVTGALAGLTQAADTRAPATATREPRGAWRVVVFVAALVIPLLGIRSFLAQYHYHRGQGATEWGLFDTAEASFAKAARLTPYDWRMHDALGMTCILTRRPADAARHFERALKRNPAHVNGLFAMAQAKFNLATETDGAPGNVLLDEAVEYARRAAQFYPEFPEVHDLLGRAAVLRAQRATEETDPTQVAAIWHDAEEHLLRAVACGAQHPDKLYQLLAQARTALDDPGGAERACVQALQAAPDNQETWRLFDGLARRTGRWRAFLTMADWRLHRLKKTSPPDAHATALTELWKAGALERGYDDHRAAANAYRAAVAAAPTDLSVWQAFYRAAQTPETRLVFHTTLVETCDAWATSETTAPPPLRAAAMAVRGEPRALREATGVLIDAVRAPEQAGTLAAARAEWDWVLDLLAGTAADPALSAYDRAMGLVDLGRVLGALGDFVTAESFFAQAQPHLPQREYVLCLQERVNGFLDVEKLSEALALLREGVARAPNDLDMRLSLARVLARDGQRAAARFEYQFLLASPQLTPEGRRLVEQELRALAP